MKKYLMFGTVLFTALTLTTGCGEKKVEVDDKKEEPKGNCAIVECMKQINASNTMEEITELIGFETTTDAMIGSDPIWKFDSKNWITYKTYNDSVTIQATINKEDLKDENIKLPLATELQEMLNNGSFTYEELVEKVGGEGTLTTISQGSVIYTWVDKHEQRLGATFNNETGRCTIASLR